MKINMKIDLVNFGWFYGTHNVIFFRHFKRMSMIVLLVYGKGIRFYYK